MNHYRAGLGCRVQAFSAIGNIRESLFLVHNQVVHHRQVFGFGLLHQMCRRVLVRSAVIHVHVQIAGNPAFCVLAKPPFLSELNLHKTICARRCNHLHGLKGALKSTHHFQMKLSRRHRNRVIAGSMKIMRLRRPNFSVEAIVRMNPARIRREKASIFGGKRDSGRRGVAVVIGHVQNDGHRRTEETALLRLDSALPGAGQRLQPQLRVFTSIGNERKCLSVRRPAHVGFVPVAVRDGKCVAALRRHDPQLVPLPPKVRAINHARAIRRKIRPRPPICFLVVNFARLRSRLRFHAPEAAGAVNVPFVRNEQNFLAVARPHRTDFHVERAVVIAGKRTLCFSRQPHYVFQSSAPHIGPENVKPLVVGSRNEHNVLSIRRPARLHVHGPAVCELLRLSRCQVQQPELDGIFLIRNVHDVFSVRRPVRLIIVSGAVRQLLRGFRIDLLPPQRSRH